MLRLQATSSTFHFKTEIKLWLPVKLFTEVKGSRGENSILCHKMQVASNFFLTV